MCISTVVAAARLKGDLVYAVEPSRTNYSEVAGSGLELAERLLC